MEKWAVKNRWAIKEKEEVEGLNEEQLKEKERLEEEAVEAYNAEKRSLDLRKVRVTRLPTCTRISFPKPAKNLEPKIQNQKEVILRAMDRFRIEEEPESGDNLNKEERIGMVRFCRRMRKAIVPNN